MATNWWVSGPSAVRIVSDDMVRIEFDSNLHVARVTTNDQRSFTLRGAETLARLRQSIMSTDWMNVEPAADGDAYDRAHLRIDFADTLAISVETDRTRKLTASRSGVTVGWTTDHAEIKRVARLLGMEVP